MQSRVVGAFALIYFLWGSTFLAIRYAVIGLPPVSLAGMRALSAGVVLYAILRARGATAPTRRAWLWATLSGALLFLCGHGTLFWCERRVPSGVAALLLASIPFWMALGEWWQSRRPLGRGLWAGLGLGFVGLVLLVGGAGAGAGVDLGAAVALVVSSMAWAAGSLLGRKVGRPALEVAAMQMLAGGALTVTVAALAGEWHGWSPAVLDARVLASFAYLVLFGSLVGFSAYGWLLGVARPSQVASYAFVNPVVAVLLGCLVGGETFTPRMLVAGACIVAGVAVMLSTRRPARA